MLFIGVGMVSTVMPTYLTLVSIHKPLGIAILILAMLRLVVRLRVGTPAPARRPARADEARRRTLPLRLVCPDDRHAADRLGHAVAPPPTRSYSSPASTFRRSSRRTTACTRCYGTLHLTLAFVFFALILLHVAAALFHALIRRDGVFEAMSPVPTSEGVVPAE